MKKPTKKPTKRAAKPRGAVATPDDKAALKAALSMRPKAWGAIDIDEGRFVEISLCPSHKNLIRRAVRLARAAGFAEGVRKASEAIENETDRHLGGAVWDKSDLLALAAAIRKATPDAK